MNNHLSLALCLLTLAGPMALAQSGQTSAPPESKGRVPSAQDADAGIDAHPEAGETAPFDNGNGEPSDQDLGKLPAEEEGALTDPNGASSPDAPANAGAAGGLTPGIINDSRFRDVAKELRCPTCTGLSVLESDASFSVQIKEQVKEQMQLGKQKDQILAFFVDRYGPWILREPPAKGFNMLAWLLPICLLGLGPILIWLLVWKRRVPANIRGVRSNDRIIDEMQEKLRILKQKGG